MEHLPRHRFPVFLAFALMLSWAVLPAQAQSEAAAETDSATVQTTAESSETATVPLGFGGLRVVVDPQTGQILADPPASATRLDLVISQDLLRRMSTSHEDLVEQPGPQGGTMVHLQGRFLSPLVAVVQPDGSVQMDHAALASTGQETTEESREVNDETP